MNTILILSIVAVVLAAVAVYYVHQTNQPQEQFAFSQQAVNNLCQQQAHMVAQSPYLSHLSTDQKYQSALNECMNDYKMNPDLVMPSAYLVAQNLPKY
jgi:sensor histidine kinase regulating citrate/malate metabolism